MVISSVAKTIREGFDEAAHVARMGGEEFVVVHTLAPDRFLEQCEGIREKIATTTVHFQDLQISTTISIGVALRGNREIFEKVMHNADMALYEAKRSGRNRICSSGAKGGRQIIA
ncbi:Diguanylate cyclase DosC [compost metagenome]